MSFFNLFSNNNRRDPQDEARLVPQCRDMLRRDVPTVLSILRQCTGKLVTEEDFLKIARPINVTTRVRVDEANRVVGYYAYGTHPKHFRLLSMAVRPVFQGRKHGAGMLLELAAKLSYEKRDKIWTAVPDTLPRAKTFLFAHGFRRVGETGGAYACTHYELRLAPKHVEAAEAAVHIPSVAPF